jgi:hypothetical protein
MKQLFVKLKDPRDFEAISRTPLGYESLNLGKSSDEKKNRDKMSWHSSWEMDTTQIPDSYVLLRLCTLLRFDP